MLNLKFRKILIILFLIILFSSVSSCFAEELPDDVKMIKVTEQKQVKSNDAREVKKTLNRFEKYVRTQNIDGIKGIISDNFINNDGFSKDAYIKMIKKTSDLYPSLHGVSEIKNIQIDGNTAEVLISEHASGKINNNNDNPLEKKGKIKLSSEYIVFLQKYGTKWSIQSIYMIKEKTVLLYSDAQLTELDLVAPNQVAKGTSYCAKLNIVHPKKFIPFASISNDKIEFPPKSPNLIFKNITSDGVLERMVNANTEGKNECVIATVGITHPTVKDSKVTIKISGMAVIMTRVNVIGQKQNFADI